MERTNWPQCRNAVITAERPPDFIQFYSIASKQAVRGSWDKTESVETLPPQSHPREPSSKLPKYCQFSPNGHPFQYI